MMRRIWTTAVGAALAVLLSSCASISVNSLPQPGAKGSNGYEVVLEFDNVLNLPDRAKVVLDGTVVGTVDRIELKGNRVDVIARIEENVAVPADIRATLQQSTVLGDTYVALERTSFGDANIPTLRSGERIPLAQTTSPPQLEDTLANLANFFGSGSIQRIQKSILQVNRVTPARTEELRAMVERVTRDLTDLSNNIETVDLWLDGVAGTAEVMRQNQEVYDYWFSPAGMVGFDRATQAAAYIGTVMPSLGSIYSGGYWLVPLLNSLADAMGAVQETKWNVESEVPAWRKLFLEYWLPQDKNPAINITSIKTPDGRELIGNVEDVLRILGAMP
jgi:virulence factor Mce-like protein